MDDILASMATAIDYEKQNELNNARMQPLKADSFHVPQNGRADNYFQDGAADNYNSEDSEQGDHASRLDEARSRMAKSEAEKTKDALSDAASVATPMGAVSLMKQINPIGDMPFFAAIGASTLKDLIDIPTFEILILPFIFSVFLGIFTVMMLLLMGANGKKKMADGLMKKGGIIIGTMLVGFVPGLNVIPEATVGTLAVYVATLSERKQQQ